MKFSSVPAYSFTGRPEHEPLTTDKQTPGPCAYDQPTNPIPASYSFSKSLRPNLFNSNPNPGPGNYMLESLSPKAVAPKKSSISPPLKEKSKQIGPGPGFYNPKPSFFSPQISMGNKIPETPVPPNPLGPGTYSPVKPTLQMSRSTVFAKSNRFVYPKSGSPGPGSYESLPFNVPNVKFAQAHRDVKESEKSPGPGRYDVHVINAVGKTIAGRNFVKSFKQVSPGPGAYEVSNVCFQTAPGFTVARAERTKVESGDKGPGFLNLATSFDGKGKTFPKAVREDLTSKNKVPGPGAFEIPSNIGEGPKITMNERRGKIQTSDVPGPAYYSPKLSESVSAATFTKQPRWDPRVNDLPGPGHYDLPKPKIPGFTFKKLSNNEADSDEEPGPGHYTIPNTIGDVPKYALNKDKKPEPNPYF